MNWLLIAGLAIFFVAHLWMMIFLDYQGVDREWGTMAIAFYTMFVIFAVMLVYESEL